MDVRFLFVVGYLLLMVGVSLYLKRKMVKSSDDFAVPQAWFIKTDLCLVSCCLQELRSE